MMVCAIEMAGDQQGEASLSTRPSNPPRDRPSFVLTDNHQKNESRSGSFEDANYHGEREAKKTCSAQAPLKNLLAGLVHVLTCTATSVA